MRLLSVGAVVPRKGFDVLIAALATLTDLSWRLMIAGDRTRDRNAAAQLDADIAHHALGNRIAAPGAVSPERLAALYAEADVFVLASRFEGYGMAYAEAVAHGLPVIGTSAGAIPDTVPPDAGLLVAPGDIPALSAGAAPRHCRCRSAAAPGWCRARGGTAASNLAAFRGDLCARTGVTGMSGFSADWLTLREPYDLRARNPAVLDAVTASLKSRPSVHIVDLACGTGSTLRALSPRLPARQNWKLIDNDLDLLARATTMPPAGDIAVTTVPLDLSRDLDAALGGPVDLVATSALLDLVSETWLDRLAAAIAARSIPLYAALSYDGRIGFTPPDPFDAAIAAAVNAHQRMDKGFGPALGPAAAGFAIARFQALGYSVVHGASDWVMGPNDRDMQTEILAGWASAAHDIGALSLVDITAWLTRRRAAVVDGCSSLYVGHVDFFATPIATR